MRFLKAFVWLLVVQATCTQAQPADSAAQKGTAQPETTRQWDTIVGTVATAGEADAHWFSVTGSDIAYLVDGDAGEVRGTLTLSMFSPALQPHLSRGRIYSYGSYYTRTYFGDRTDVVMLFDSALMQPVGEVEIPPKSAGMGHSGMIGLIDQRFLGVWNITPAMSVSLVDVDQERFLGEISTPGCSGVYPLGRGFLMPCAMGALQYIALDENGTETGRSVSPTFFDVDQDPIYDYAVPTADGWLFVSLDGRVFEATIDGDTVNISEPWSIIERAGDDAADWRIGGGQPFAYNAEAGVLMTLMHEGGGQETYRDPGSEVWAFNTKQRRRGYRLALDSPAKGIQLTQDKAPLLLISPKESDIFSIHDAMTGRKLREMEDISGLIQPLSGQAP